MAQQRSLLLVDIYVQSVVAYKQSVIAWLRPLILPKNKQLPDHGWYQLLIILAVSALYVTGLTLAGRRPDARSVETLRVAIDGATATRATSDNSNIAAR